MWKTIAAFKVVDDFILLNCSIWRFAETEDLIEQNAIGPSEKIDFREYTTIEFESIRVEFNRSKEELLKSEEKKSAV